MNVFVKFENKTVLEIIVCISKTFSIESNKQKSLNLVYFNGKEKHIGIQIVFLHKQVGKYYCLYGFKVYDPKGNKTKIELAKELSVKSFMNIVMLSYLWLHHTKNQKSERVNAKKIKYGVCDVLSEMRKLIKDFFDLNRDESIKILLNEFVSERLQIENLE